MNLLEWTGAYGTVRGEPFSFLNYHFLRDLYKDDSEYIIVQKASQMGFSEWCVNTALWFADEGKGNVLYFFPTQNVMDDFSKARISERINDSDYLIKRVSQEGEDSRGEKIDSVRLRKLGKHYMYFRGSDNTRQLITIDADLLIRDELDFMKPVNLPIMEKRLGASQYKWKRDISTPSYPDFGIHKAYLTTDQRKYLLKCPHCNHWQELDFFENVKFTTPEDGKVVCVKCGGKLNRFAEGEWVAEYPDKSTHGYRINRLYSPFATLKELITNSLKHSESEVQTFFNFELGKERAPKGGKISRDIILACTEEGYEMPLNSRTPCSMGVDVGKVLNVRISRKTEWGRRAVFIGMVDSFEELGDLMIRYNVNLCCIDAMPETRKVKEFAKRFEGKVKLVYFSSQTEKVKEKEGDERIKCLHCDRTQVIDDVVAEFVKGRNILPCNIEGIDEYIKQVTAPVRVIEKDKSGRDIPRWIESGPDHYMFSEVYDYLACYIGATKRAGTAVTWV